MRIELPPATWADAAPRAEDDAHTLTIAVQPTTDWALLPGEVGPGLPGRVEVSRAESLTVTLTF